MSSAACRQISEDAVEISAKSPAHAQQISKHLREAASFAEVVPGIASVTVLFDPLIVSASDVTKEMLRVFDNAPDHFEARVAPVEIPITYGGDAGPDLKVVCETLRIDEGAFISQHTRAVHTVDMIGFTPGFAYVSGLGNELNVARRATPRPRLPAGSIGISGEYTGIYALAGPGGWPIIGRTNVQLFNPQAEDPFLLVPGQQIKFVQA